jgi:hypothetical protein
MRNTIKLLIARTFFAASFLVTLASPTFASTKYVAVDLLEPLCGLSLDPASVVSAEKPIHCMIGIEKGETSFGTPKAPLQRTTYVSLLGRLIVLLREQAALYGVEELVKKLVRLISPEMRNKLCHVIDEIEVFVVAAEVKPEARLAILKVIWELKRLTSCSSFAVKPSQGSRL